MRTRGSGEKALDGARTTTASQAPRRRATPRTGEAVAPPVRAPRRPVSERALVRKAKNEQALAELTATQTSDKFGGARPPPGTQRRSVDLSRPVPPRTRPTIVEAGGFRIHTSGVAAEGIQESVNIARRLAVRPDVAERLRERKVDLVLLPHDKKLTDLPQFSGLRGKSTFDGRPWDQVRGVANVVQPDGRVAVALPEENLLELPSDPYPGNFSVGIHEVAHAIHEFGLSEADHQQVAQSFAAHKAAGGRFTDDYAASNEYEYFAQATNAYLGRNGGQGENGAAWLKQHDPRLHAVLERVYGPPAPFKSVHEAQVRVPVRRPRVPSGETPRIERPLLRRTARGEEVKALQQRLRAAGFLAGAADGIFGPQTERAVRKYQRAQGLKADGIVGPLTWGALIPE